MSTDSSFVKITLEWFCKKKSVKWTRTLEFEESCGEENQNDYSIKTGTYKQLESTQMLCLRFTSPVFQKCVILTNHVSIIGNL